MQYRRWLLPEKHDLPETAYMQRSSGLFCMQPPFHLLLMLVVITQWHTYTQAQNLKRDAVAKCADSQKVCPSLMKINQSKCDCIDSLTSWSTCA